MEATSHQVIGHECKFQVLTALATKIINLNWKSLNLDNLSNSLMPFILAPHTPKERTEQQHKVDMATIVYLGAQLQPCRMQLTYLPMMKPTCCWTGHKQKAHFIMPIGIGPPDHMVCLSPISPR